MSAVGAVSNFCSSTLKDKNRTRTNKFWWWAPLRRVFSSMSTLSSNFAKVSLSTLGSCSCPYLQHLGSITKFKQGCGSGSIRQIQIRNQDLQFQILNNFLNDDGQKRHFFNEVITIWVFNFWSIMCMVNFTILYKKGIYYRETWPGTSLSFRRASRKTNNKFASAGYRTRVARVAAGRLYADNSEPIQ